MLRAIERVVSKIHYNANRQYTESQKAATIQVWLEEATSLPQNVIVLSATENPCISTFTTSDNWDVAQRIANRFALRPIIIVGEFDECCSLGSKLDRL